MDGVDLSKQRDRLRVGAELFICHFLVFVRTVVKFSVRCMSVAILHRLIMKVYTTDNVLCLPF